MTINFYDAINEDGLFNLQGAALKPQEALFTQLGTTIPGFVVDAKNIHNNVTNDDEFMLVARSLTDSLNTIQQSASGGVSALNRYVIDIATKIVQDDAPQERIDTQLALEEIIRQMISGAESVDASTTSATATPSVSNAGDGFVVMTTIRGDGLLSEHAYNETMNIRLSGNGRTPSFSFNGEPSVGLLSSQWPQGSGSSGTVVPVDGDGLLTNGVFETDEEITNHPDDWIVSTGVVGTTVFMSTMEVQTVIISGTPTGGYYNLLWSNEDSDIQSTDPIDWDASGSTVQAELKKLTGLEEVTVTTTGTSPNYTHTITGFKLGDVAQLTSNDQLTGGTPLISHATTTAGSGNVYHGEKSLKLTSDGAENTTLVQRLENLLPETSYALGFWASVSAVPAAGAASFSLVDGVGGSAIADSEGTNNTFSVDCTTLLTTWKTSKTLATPIFRTPAVVPDIVYLEIKITTPLDSGKSLFIDHMSLAQMNELYSGGPSAAVFTGHDPWAEEDSWTVTVTNDYAGKVQNYYNRNFNMASLGLQLPSNNAGAETIPDTVIS